MKAEVEIKHCPAEPRRFVVARVEEGALWYWGSWNTEGLAKIAAEDVAGAVLIDTGAEA